MNEHMTGDFSQMALNPDEPPSGGIEKETKERTKESEIKANIDFWKDLGIEVDEEEVRREIEAIPDVKGYDWYTYIPMGIKLEDIWKLAKEKFSALGGKYANLIEMPESGEKSQAFAARYQQEPEKFSLGELAKSTRKWEETNFHFMNPLVRIICEMRWFQSEGSHLDEINATIFPNTRDGENGARIRYPADLNAVYFESIDLDKTYGKEGVRLVITRDTSSEDIEQIKTLSEK